MNIYDVGDGIRLRAAFTVTGVYTDPDIVTFSVRDPSKNIDIYNYTSGTVSKLTDGVFILDIFVDEPGQWWYEVFGTGTALAADENYFLVERSVIP
jgi:hypothetical protein